MRAKCKCCQHSRISNVKYTKLNNAESKMSSRTKSEYCCSPWETTVLLLLLPDVDGDVDAAAVASTHQQYSLSVSCYIL